MDFNYCAIWDGFRKHIRFIVGTCLLYTYKKQQYPKQKQPGCKNIQGQSEAAMIISD